MHLRQDVADVVPGVTVQALLQSLLVQEMTNETDRATQNEETVEGSVLDYVLWFILREEAAGIEIISLVLI